MKNIVVVSLYDGTLSGGRVSRLSGLLPLIEKEYKVTLVSGNFNHGKKEPLVVSDSFYKRFPDTEIKLLNQPKYLKNICLKRIYSNEKFSELLKKYLKQTDFDLVYVCMQDLLVGNAVRKVCLKKNKPYIVDIQDLWPAAFRMKYSNKFVETFIYSRLEKLADKIYDDASYVIAISDTYRQRGILNKKDKQNSLAVYNGIDLSEYITVQKKELKTNKGNEFWVIYNGTMGNSYNVPLIIDAVAKLNNMGHSDIRFIALGNGPYFNKWKEYAEKIGCNATFHTYDDVSYEEMLGYLGSSDVAVNPIFNTAPQSISHKIRDYACSALPVISTQQNQEYKEIVDNLEIGINCNNDLDEVISAILKIKNNSELKDKMKKNNIELFRERFNSTVTYIQIVEIIHNLIRGKNK